MTDGTKSKYLGCDIDEFVERGNWIDTRYKECHEGEMSEGHIEIRGMKLSAYLRHNPDPRTGARYNLMLNGSLHVFHNGGHHNHDRFTLKNIRKTISEIGAVFNLDPQYFELQNLETAVNVKSNADRILNNLISHKGHRFNDKKQEYGWKMMTVKSGNTGWKIYDKRDHHKLPTELLRIERKVFRNSELQKHGISTVADLSDPDKILSLSIELYFSWSQVIIDEPTIRMDELTLKQKNKLARYRNPRSWEKKRIYCKERASMKDDFRSIVQNHSKNIHGHISDLIVEEIDAVMGYEKGRFTRVFKERTKGRSPIYYIGVDRPIDEVRRCKATGMDISHQREGSLYLSQSSLMRLSKEDPKTYESIRDKYIFDGGRGQSLQKVCERIHHKFRNDVSNGKQSQMKYERKGLIEIPFEDVA